MTTLKQYARDKGMSDEQVKTLMAMRIENWKVIWPDDDDLALYTRTDIRGEERVRVGR